MEAVKIENGSSLIFSSKYINSTHCQFCGGETGPGQIQFVEENSVEDTCWRKILKSKFANGCPTNSNQFKPIHANSTQLKSIKIN